MPMPLVGGAAMSVVGVGKAMPMVGVGALMPMVRLGAAMCCRSTRPCIRCLAL